MALLLYSLSLRSQLLFGSQQLSAVWSAEMYPEPCYQRPFDSQHLHVAAASVFSLALSSATHWLVVSVSHSFSSEVSAALFALFLFSVSNKALLVLFLQLPRPVKVLLSVCCCFHGAMLLVQVLERQYVYTDTMAAW